MDEKKTTTRKERDCSFGVEKRGSGYVFVGFCLCFLSEEEEGEIVRIG
jgi:hypothetical protein